MNDNNLMSSDILDCDDLNDGIVYGEGGVGF